MSIFSNPEKEFAKIWDEIKSIFHADVQPFLEQFLKQFASADGKLILTDGIAAATALASGTSFGAVAATLVTDLLAKSQTLAAQDALQTLQQIQSALQIGKVVGNVVTPSDQKAIEAMKPTA